MAVKQVDEFEGIEKHLQYAPSDFRIGRLDAEFMPDEEDAENIVEEYYRRLDYEVFKLRGISDDDERYLKKWFAFFDGFNFSQPGIPDYFVCRIFIQPRTSKQDYIRSDAKVQDYRFVEVKSGNDRLRMNQLKWIGSHPNLPIEVIIVE